jgi:hypothetical protein
MTAKKFFMYIVSLLMLILPVPGRFSCGIVIVLLFNLIVCTGTLFFRAVVLLKLENLYQILMVFFLLCVTIFYRQLLILFSPVLALTLGITLFVTALCAYEISNFVDFPAEQAATKEGLRVLLRANMRRSFIFSLPALGFFLLREIIGYGAISLPAPSGMLELVFPFSGMFVLSILWTSIPGAVILVAVLLSIAIFVYRTLLEFKAERHGSDKDVQ